MKKVIILLVVVFLLGSCRTQEKSIELANGKMVTQKQYDKMIDHAFKSAEKQARKAVKGKMSKKQIREFHKSIIVEVDTLAN